MSAEVLSRALGYPYALPGVSYVVDGADVLPFVAETAANHRQGRTAVLAVGSNQSPAQIARKFQGNGWSPIPCERCVIEDFDTVYSAHITNYGSVPAALHPCPGTHVNLYVNYLDSDQLSRMHETELGNENYAYARLDGIRLKTEHGLELDSVHFYRSNAGAFSPFGAPVPLAEVGAENRCWQAMSQHEMQTLVHERTATSHVFEAFVLSATTDASERARRKRHMAETAEPFHFERLTVIES